MDRNDHDASFGQTSKTQTAGPRNDWPDLPQGHCLGNYTIVRCLGVGGESVVYQAKDEKLLRLVALKMPRGGCHASPEELDRAVEEARKLVRLRHHGIVSVFHVDCDPRGRPYLVLEYMEGGSLKDLLGQTDRQTRPSHVQFVEMLIEVCQALGHAHEQGFIHRDIKPGNILLDARGRPRLADFGLALHETAQQAHRGLTAGTAPYMAPEQVRGEVEWMDGRADIWALGAVLYEMLTGRRPFQGDDFQELSREILHRQPRPPRMIERAVPAELERICLRCLEKNIAARYRTAGDLARDLQQWLESAGEEEFDRKRPPAGPFVDDAIARLFRTSQSRSAFSGRIWTQREGLGITRDLVTVRQNSKACYRIGDAFVLHVEAERDCYLTLLELGSSGRMYLLAENVPLQANAVLAMTGPDAMQRWIVGDPPGVESIKAFFTRAPLRIGSRTRDLRSEARELGQLLEDMPESAWTDAMCQFVVEPSRSESQGRGT